MSNKLVFVVCYTNPLNIVSTIKSLTDGQLRPTDIIVADYGVPLPASLKKKDMVRIVRTQNYGALSSIYAALEKYGTSESVHYILVDAQVSYMVHLASDMLNAAQEIERNFKSALTEKKLDFNGAVYGLNGIVFTEDKQKSLDDELALLTGSSESNVSNVSNCPIKPNVVKDTTPVDLLEFAGAIYVRGPFFEGFKDLIADFKNCTVAEAAVTLSNFFATRGIYRVQMCHLANNRFIMERIGCFTKVESISYASSIEILHTKGTLNLCNDRITK